MCTSSSTTRSNSPEASRAAARSSAAVAAATSRSRSCVFQVNPSPIVSQTSSSGKRAKNSRSPVFHVPLMNCTTATRCPQPSARATTPNAELDFPLP